MVPGRPADKLRDRCQPCVCAYQIARDNLDGSLQTEGSDENLQVAQIRCSAKYSIFPALVTTRSKLFRVGWRQTRRALPTKRLDRKLGVKGFRFVTNAGVGSRGMHAVVSASIPGGKQSY